MPPKNTKAEVATKMDELSAEEQEKVARYVERIVEAKAEVTPPDTSVIAMAYDALTDEQKLDVSRRIAQHANEAAEQSARQAARLARKAEREARP